MRLPGRAAAVALAGAACLSASCSSTSSQPPGAVIAAVRAASGASSPTTSIRSVTPRRSRRSSPASHTSASSASPQRHTPTEVTQLPLGGRAILPRFRVVAYYGGPDGPTLGILGSEPPDVIADQIERQADRYRRFGRPVQPAMELIADVAQASPGPDGDYSTPIAAADIRRYLSAAHAHHMLLILDVQPGSGRFLPDVEALRPFLLDPSVSIALDPEWKVAPGEAPGGGLIGSTSARAVNAVGRYLSGLVQDNGLPDKLLIVHEFTLTMLPHRNRIEQYPGLELVFHADGEGAPDAKVAVYRQLAFPGPPIGSGFKVFFTEDTRVMSPAEVMALRPRPDIVTYQ